MKGFEIQAPCGLCLLDNADAQLAAEVINRQRPGSSVWWMRVKVYNKDGTTKATPSLLEQQAKQANCPHPYERILSHKRR
jgi:hypothetical protein